MGDWIVNGVKLSTLATNVTNRDAGWRVPAKRGSNLEVTGRDGAIWTPNKPFAQGHVPMNMWALGCMPDGTMPTSPSRAQICRDNIQRLFSLFTSTAALCEVIRVESKGYGQINRFPNPSTRATVAGSTGYRNHVKNPAQAIRSQQELMRNLIVDPDVKYNPTRPVYAQNLAPDPLFQAFRDPAGTAFDTNYWGSTSWEDPAWPADVALPATWWRSASGVTAIVRTVAGGRGKQALEVAATSALAANADLGARQPFRFPGGSTPNFRFLMRRRLNTTTVRTLQLRASFYDTAGVLLSSSAWKSVTIPSGTGWVQAQLPSGSTGPSPDDTYTCSLDMRTGEAWVTGDGFYMDAVQASEYTGIATESAPFWDGDMLYGTWNSTANRSVARWYLNVDPRWTVTAQNAYYAMAASIPADSGGTSLGFYAFRAAGGGTQTFELQAAAATAGTPYTLRFRGRALVGTTPTVELISTDINGSASRGQVQVTGSGVGDVLGIAGAETSYVGPTYTPAAGETLSIRVTVPVRAYGEPVLQLTALGLTDYGFIASGSSTSTANTSFAWAGAVNSSATNILRDASSIIASKHAVTYTVSDIDAGKVNVVDVQCLQSGVATSILFKDAPVTPTALVNGFRFNAFCVSTPDYGAGAATVRAVVRAISSTNTVLATYTGGNVPLNLTSKGIGDFKTVAVRSATLPTSTVSLRCSIEFVNPLVGQIVDATRFLLSDRNTARLTYLDPAAANFAWLGTANRSQSIMRTSASTSTGYTAGHGIYASGQRSGQTIVEGVESAESAVDVAVAGPITGMYKVGTQVASSEHGDVVVQLLSASGAIQQEEFMGRLFGNPVLPELESMQAVIVSTGPVAAVRIVLRADVVQDSSDLFAVGKTYLIQQPASQAPRFSGNRITNPQWVQQVRGWQTSSAGQTVYKTANAFGVCLHSNGADAVNTAKIPATAGQSVWVWARVESQATLQLQVSWYNSSGTLLSSAIAATSTPVDRVRNVQGTITAPTSTAWGTLTVVEPGWTAGGFSFNVFGAYASAVVANRDTGTSSYDPTEWDYFDGSTGTDFAGNITSWTGTPNASESNAGVQVPAQWQLGSIVALSRPTLRPPGSTGTVVAFPAVGAAVTAPTIGGAPYGSFTVGYSGGATASSGGAPVTGSVLYGRTLPIQMEGVYLSGQVAVARKDISSTVTVRLMGCTDSTGATAFLLYQETLTGFTATVTWRDITSDYPFYFLEVQYTENVAATGYVVTVDNVLLLDNPTPLSEDYPGFFDGSTGSAGWTGSPNASPSINYAGARRFFGEVVDAIEPASMAGGTRAEFDVEWQVPAAFWEDLALSTTVAQTSDTITDVPLTEFTGTAQRITDAVIRVDQLLGSGPANITITDVRTGAWVKLSQVMAVGDYITLTCARFKATLTHTGTNGPVTTSLGPVMSRGGASPLLSLTPYSIDSPPVLRVQTGAYSGTLQVTVTGRKKYAIA